MKSRLLLLTACCILLVPCSQSSADVTDVLTDGFINSNGILDQRVVAAAREAEEFWDARITRFRSDMPLIVLQNLDRVQINCSIGAAPAPGVLAFATNDDIYTYRPNGNGLFGGAETARPWGVVQEASITVVEDQIDFMVESGQLTSVMIHEMAHALGFSSTLFGINELTQGTLYTGEHGLAQYREEIDNPFVRGVPLDPGSLSHWRFGVDFFENDQRQEFMLPAIGNVPYFLSQATQGVMADVGYHIDGIVDDPFRDVVGGGIFSWHNGLGGFGNIGFRNGSVPEPGSASILLAGLLGIAIRRKQR